MTKERWAEFIGFQKDERIGGVRPFFILHVPDSDRDQSTVFTETVRQLGIELPKIPTYEPEHFKEVWMPKCETCQITWFSIPPACDHIRENHNHHMIMYKVPIAENEGFKPLPPAKVWIRDKAQNNLVLDGTVHLTEEDTQPLNMDEIMKEEYVPLPIAKKTKELLEQIRKERPVKAPEKVDKIISIPVPEPEELIVEDEEELLEMEPEPELGESDFSKRMKKGFPFLTGE